MSEPRCQFCKKEYNDGENIPMLLECGDSCCSSCINKLNEILYKDEFECSLCCRMTKSTKIKNRHLIPKKSSSNLANKLKASKSNTGSEKFSVFVTKEKTIGELKEKIQNEKGFDSEVLNNKIKELNNKIHSLQKKTSQKDEELNKLKEQLKKNKNKIIEDKIEELKKELSNKENRIKELISKKEFEKVPGNLFESKEELYKIIVEKDRELKELKLKLDRYPIKLKKEKN